MIEERTPENIRVKQSSIDQSRRIAFDFDGCSREQLEWMQGKFTLLKGRVSLSVLLRYATDLLYQKLIGQGTDVILDEWETLKKYAEGREKAPSERIG